jgi:hypothetical protein
MIGRGFGLLSIVLVGFALWGLVRQVRKPLTVRPSGNLIGIAMAPIMLVVNVVVLRQAAPGLLGPSLLVLGLGFGLAWGQVARLRTQDGRVIAERSILHLFFWGVSYAVTQVLATFATAAWVAGGLVAMFFAAGTTLGTNANLFVRQLLLRSSTKEARPGGRLSTPG